VSCRVGGSLVRMSDPYGTPQPPHDEPQPAYGAPQPDQYGYPGRYSGQDAGYPSGYPATDPGQPGGYPAGYGAHGYAQPGQGYPPAAQQQSDDTMWVIFSYVGMLVAGFLAPLIIYFVKRNDSQFVRFHSAQCLNSVITSFGYALAGGLLIALIVIPSAIAEAPIGIGLGVFVGVLAFMALGITQLVFLIIAVVRSSRYEWYRMPTWLAYPLVK
jgi:uncharacterized Tic20 family protein